MEKLKRNICILVFVGIICFLFSQCYAIEEYIKSDFTVDGTATVPSTANKVISNVWGSVKLILQILSVMAIIVAGIRYMFTSADKKADIKKQSVGLIAGAMLVFAASSVVGFIVNVFKEAVKQGI